MRERRIKNLEDLHAFCNKLHMRKWTSEVRFFVEKVKWRGRRPPAIRVKMRINAIQDVPNWQRWWLTGGDFVPLPRLGRRSYAESDVFKRVIWCVGRMILHEVFETVSIGKEHPVDPHRKFRERDPHYTFGFAQHNLIKQVGDESRYNPKCWDDSL